MDKNIKKLIEYPKQGILSKDILKTEKLDVSLFCMAKESKLGEHTSTREGIIYVIEGSGIFNLEEKEIKMEPGIFIHMDKNAIHSLKVNENTSFLLILIK